LIQSIATALISGRPFNVARAASKTIGCKTHEIGCSAKWLVVVSTIAINSVCGCIIMCVCVRVCVCAWVHMPVHEHPFLHAYYSPPLFFDFCKPGTLFEAGHLWRASNLQCRSGRARMHASSTICTFALIYSTLKMMSLE